MNPTNPRFAARLGLAKTNALASNVLRRRRLGARLLTGTVLGAGLVLPMAAAAQDTPPRQVVDARGVDVASGQAIVATPSISMADMGYAERWTGELGHSVLQGAVTGSGILHVTINGKTRRFNSNGSGGFVPADADGSTLVYVSTTDHYIYTEADGTEYIFVDMDAGPAPRRHLSLITRPDGTRIEYVYRIHDNFDCGRPTCASTMRVQSIVSSKGFMIKPEYVSQSETSGDFGLLASIKIIDRSLDYCNPGADLCTGLTQAPPVLTESRTTSGTTTTTTITDEDSETTTVVSGSSGVTSVNEPTTGDDVSITYSSGRVATITRNGVTYTYNYVTSGTTLTTTVTAPDSSTESYAVNTTTTRLASATSPTGDTVSYQYDASGRVTRKTMPEGNYTQYTYDGRGNVTEERHVAKSGSGIADIVTTWNFSATCANSLVCNKPNYTIDPRGKRTDFTYNATHGGLTRLQLPSPDGVLPRPQIDYAYTALYAQVKNSSGTLVNVSTPVYKVTQITTCATAATCANSVNETEITLAYNTPNLSLTSKTVAAGNGSVSSTETYAYDSREQLTSADGPLAGAADTTFYHYGPKGHLRGIIGPDPDGAGALKRRAVRHFPTPAGKNLKTQIGTTTGTTYSDLLTMTVLEQTDYSYDPDGRLTKQAASAGGTTYYVQQSSYDNKGQLQCAALRMNPAVFASLPASACALGTAGSFGPDRITRNTYDAAGRVTLVQSAYGVTGVEADEVAATYSDNGQIATVTDGEGNRTTYEYDGQDRLSKTRYPSPTADNTSSTTDYEQLVYDAASNVTSRRLRGYASDSTRKIDYSYDNLNRVTLKNLPSPETDVTYTYDLLGRMTGASRTGHALSFTFDALGRNLTQVSPLGTVSYQYDSAGRRTRMTWPDAFYVTYDYQVTGEIKRILQSGTTELVNHAYDDYGRLTSLTRLSGAPTSYTWDAVSRLTSLAHNLASTANDVSWSFPAYNPAGQQLRSIRNNDLYAWGGAANVNRPYTINGRNQVTLSGTTALGYDARGNLTSLGSSAYTYSAENLLLTGPSATLTYDPALRLYQTVGAATTRFLYDGTALIGEYNAAGTLLRRYVHDAAVDAPLVWYEGAGTTDRRFLHADERGSIVAVTNSSGAVLAGGINSYDEYGMPGAANMGRFQYTGQTWVPELSMYYYKARIYHPSLGRFMQTDPIGYGGGMNIYAYVRNDPVNRIDPTGLCDDRTLADSTNEPCDDDIVVTGRPDSKWETYVGPIPGGSGREGGDGGGGGSRGSNATLCPGGFAPNSDKDDELYDDVRADPDVAAKMLEALKKTAATGVEWSFWIYRDGGGFRTGQLHRGLKGGTGPGHHIESLSNIGANRAVASFHTHPSGALWPSDGDITYNQFRGALSIIGTNDGMIAGRKCIRR